MGPERITVSAGGQSWSAWTSASVGASAKEAARSFRLAVAAEVGAIATAWTFKAGTLVTITANGSLLCTGYVDRYQPSISATDASVTITGRSKSQDAIDSSAIHKTGRFEKKTAVDIANELGKTVGVTFAADDTLPTLAKWQITPGETIFQGVERLARDHGYTLSGQPDGSVKFFKADKAQSQAGALVEGVNILSGEADHNWSNRHSEYRVRGQRALGTTPDDLQIEAIARDAGVGRYRPLVIVEQKDTDKERAKGKAGARRDKQAGASLSASITVQGFRDEGGELWTPGRKVWVESPYLYLTQDMLIESVTYSQDRSGSLTKLSLVDPKAHGGKTGKAAKSGDAWTVGATAPEATSAGSGE